ncbi:MAG: hypothetical protein JNL82_15410 [Myxococcales bacterium]|nr:hypothetical protein [Myxococcales bacterium]
MPLEIRGTIIGNIIETPATRRLQRGCAWILSNQARIPSVAVSRLRTAPSSAWSWVSVSTMTGGSPAISAAIMSVCAAGGSASVGVGAVGISASDGGRRRRHSCGDLGARVYRNRDGRPLSTAAPLLAPQRRLLRLTLSRRPPLGILRCGLGRPASGGLLGFTSGGFFGASPGSFRRLSRRVVLGLLGGHVLGEDVAREAKELDHLPQPHQPSVGARAATFKAPWCRPPGCR